MNRMRPFRDISIRRKLIIMGIIASSAALLLACSAFLGYGLFSYRETMIHILSVRANIIGTNAASGILFNDESAAADSAEPEVQRNLPGPDRTLDDGVIVVTAVGGFLNHRARPKTSAPTRAKPTPTAALQP